MRPASPRQTPGRAPPPPLRPFWFSDQAVAVNTRFSSMLTSRLQALSERLRLAIDLQQHVAQGPPLVIGQHPWPRSMRAHQAELAVPIAWVHAVQVERSRRFSRSRAFPPLPAAAACRSSAPRRAPRSSPGAAAPGRAPPRPRPRRWRRHCAWRREPVLDRTARPDGSSPWACSPCHPSPGRVPRTPSRNPRAPTAARCAPHPS
jgi:hypothetical protein